MTTHGHSIDVVNSLQTQPSSTLNAHLLHKYSNDYSSDEVTESERQRGISKKGKNSETIQTHKQSYSNFPSSFNMNNNHHHHHLLTNIDELTPIITNDTTTLDKVYLGGGGSAKRSHLRFSIDGGDAHGIKNNQNKKVKPHQVPHETHLGHCDVYIELEEAHLNERDFFHKSTSSNLPILSNYEFRVRSRWIKYEQTIDMISGHWSKPFVGSLVYQNLITLKNRMQYASIIFKSKENTFERIVDEVIDDLINRGQLNKEKKDELKSVLLTQKRNKQTLGAGLSGVPSSSKKRGSSALFSLINNSTNDFTSHRRHSILHSHNTSTNDPVKFFIASSNTLTGVGVNDTAAEDKSSIQSNENVNLRNSSPVNIRPSMSITMPAPYHQFRQSLKSHHHHFGHYTKSDNSFHRVEAFAIMVGVVEFLVKPVMAFIRLTDDQFGDK